MKEIFIVYGFSGEVDKLGFPLGVFEKYDEAKEFIRNNIIAYSQYTVEMRFTIA